ncbi:MAG: KamA family radical SAM protein [Sphaerochaetaceae bacterium]
MSGINSMKELAGRLALTGDEAAFDEKAPHLPVKITDYFFSLINPDDPNDPLRRQVVPTRFEENPQSYEDLDPLEEVSHSVTSRLIHRYRSRVAFLVTDLCPMYCRHCFRRRFTGTFQGPATHAETEEAAAYCKKHPEVTEILFTGGDMMTLSDEEIDHLIAVFRSKRPDLIIRLCTRICATLPQRVTDSLVKMITSHNSAPFYLMTQFNHPRELTEQAVTAVAKFVDHGIPAMNQTVLLRGVNDDPDTLEQLCNRLVVSRIKPYYLFQGDLVSGTERFRVPLRRGMEIEQELRRRLSGLAMPVYAADLPRGGGKIPLCQNYLEAYDGNGTWTFRTPDGEIRHYRDPIE